MRLFLLAAVLIVSIGPAAVSAATFTEANALFTDVPALDSTLASADTISPAGLRRRIVQININRLLTNTPAVSTARRVQHEVITLNLFEDIIAEVSRTKTYQNNSESFTWIGSAVGERSTSALFVVNEDSRVYGTITLPDVGTFSIRPRSAPSVEHIIEQIDTASMLSGASDTYRPVLPGLDALTAERPARYTDISSDDGAMVDVYVAYDRDVRGGAVAAGDALAFAELFIAYTNQAYENSGINQRVWLVGSVEGYDYHDAVDTDETSLQTVLNALTDGVIEGLHAKRDEYHADLVVFFVPFRGASCRGLAALQVTNENIDWNRFAFSTMEACAFGQSVFAHELGHNMGSRHDWYTDSAIAPASIGHGYIDTERNFRTIMSYNNRCSVLGITCPTIAHFSNPQITYAGAPTGVPGGTSVSCVAGDAKPPLECDSDNTHHFDRKAPTTARFRDSRLTWTGAIDADWATAGNWIIHEGAPGFTQAVNRVPRAYDNVYIPKGLEIYPSIASGTARARELVITEGAALTMSGGRLAVGWNWKDAGGFEATGGTVVFSGPVGARITTAGSFWHVQIGTAADTGEVILNSDFDVNGDLRMSAGSRLVAGEHTINIAGNWQEDDPTGFQYGSGTVIFDGAVQSVNKVTSVAVLNEGFNKGDGRGCGCNTAYLPTGWTAENAWFGGELSRDGDAIATGNGWLHSVALPLDKTVNYTLSFDFEQFRGADELQVYYGNTASSAGMKQRVGTVSSTGSAEFSFSVPDSGTYYIGFHHQGTDWSYIDNVLLTGQSALNFHNVHIASGMTAFKANVAVASDLRTLRGASADFLTYDVSVEGVVSNRGGIRQTKTVPGNMTTAFLRINNAAGTTNKYHGVEMMPDSGSMGSTSVEVKGNQQCAHAELGLPVGVGRINRCFTITPAAARTSTVRFYYRAVERNDIAQPMVYLRAGDAWEQQTRLDSGGSDDALWVTGTGLTAYGHFLLSADN